MGFYIYWYFFCIHYGLTKLAGSPARILQIKDELQKKNASYLCAIKPTN